MLKLIGLNFILIDLKDYKKKSDNFFKNIYLNIIMAKLKMSEICPFKYIFIMLC